VYTLTPHLLPDAEALAGAALTTERALIFTAAAAPLLLIPLLPAQAAYFMGYLSSFL